MHINGLDGLLLINVNGRVCERLRIVCGFHLRLDLPSSLFSSAYSTAILHAFLTSDTVTASDNLKYN
jgi:hypothetical protein